MGERKTKRQKTEKLSGTEQVLAYLELLEHPLKQEILEVRTIILQIDHPITEHIKWNAPSFCIYNEDRITFNFYGANKFRLVFHCGAKKIKTNECKGKLIDDQSGLLEWLADDRAAITFTSAEDLNEDNRNHIKEVVTKWIEATKNL